MSPQLERRTTSDIRRAVRTGALRQPFRRNDVSKAIGRSLLPKQRVGKIRTAEPNCFGRSIADYTASSKAKDSLGSSASCLSRASAD
jgi:hypothetical protein